MSSDLFSINADNLDRVSSWSKNADQRANIVLAFNGGLVALLVTDNVYTYDFFSRFSEGSLFGYFDVFALILFFFFVAFFFLSVFCALRVLMADARQSRCEKSFLFSFFTIGLLRREEYRQRLHKVSQEDVLHALEDQTHLASVVARAKFFWLSRSWWFLGGAIMSAITFILLSLFL